MFKVLPPAPYLEGAADAEICEGCADQDINGAPWRIPRDVAGQV